ncbi:MAG: hypothetical protein KDB82_06040 [Planctomycetes bacterium]|nr:hypothetical protein [Planctomycetota bacterium]
MDGGQVALSADGETQLNAWMNNEGNKKRLFFASLKPGESPTVSGLVDIAGQQSHPVIAALEGGKALIAFEANETIGAAVLDKDGKVLKKQMLANKGRYPRLVRTKDAIVVTWESSEGVQISRVEQSWWAEKK